MADLSRPIGLFALLRSATGLPGYGSSKISALVNTQTGCRRLFIDRVPKVSWRATAVMVRALRGKPAATARDWNRLAVKLHRRNGSGLLPHIEALRHGGFGDDAIVAWRIDGGPIFPRTADLLSYSASEQRWSRSIESAKRVMRDVLPEAVWTPAFPECIERCGVCGQRIAVAFEPGHDWWTQRARASKGTANAAWTKWGRTCKDRRCRAIAHLFPGGKEPLEKLLIEVTKHGGKNENFRRLAKHFV